MKIVVSVKSQDSIYAQIKAQIKEQILEGTAREKEQLPSIRQLARDLQISVITVTRAYTDLVEEGFLIAQAGKGYFVASKNNDLIRERILSRIEGELESAIKNGRDIGLNDQELMDIFKVILEEIP